MALSTIFVTSSKEFLWPFREFGNAIQGYIPAMKRILLTGFEPFNKATSNSSQEIVRAIEAERFINVFTSVLPVEFGRSSQTLIELINEVNPDYVICLGQAEGRAQITPEKIAVNLDDARIPDNAGNQPKNHAIVIKGPDGLFSTLPVDNIVEILLAAKIPAAISFSAGTFVCNHIFYALQNYCKDKEISSGFIHFPLMVSQAAEFPGLPTMPLETMVEAVKLIIAELIPS